MLRNFFYQILARRHFWRYASFDQVAELYASKMLRMAAMHMAGAFMSIYLYQLGYSFSLIGFFWAAFYILKVVLSLPIARVVAWIGPKHSSLVANLMYIPAMIGFVLLPTYGVWLLVPILVLQGISSAMYSIAYTINFSKVKSVKHAGREIAFMNIFEKITTGLSPLIGGFIAFIWGPAVVIVVSAVLFLFAAAPLFRSGEPVRRKQKLTFRGFPWRLLFRHSLGHFSLGFDVFSTGTVWSLYIAVIILNIAVVGDEAYAVTGALISVVFIAAIIASYIYGKLIDGRRGGELMRFGAVAKAITHLVRPLINTPIAVAGLNATSELATTGFTLPYTRGVFDNADMSGARTTYIGMTEAIANLGAGVSALLLGIGALFLPEISALQLMFFAAAGVALLGLTARFPLYKR